MRSRDMTRAEFNAALSRRGFSGPVFWWFTDTTGVAPHVSFGGVYNNNGKLCRRATLAHLIKSRDRHALQPLKKEAE